VKKTKIPKKNNTDLAAAYIVDSGSRSGSSGGEMSRLLKFQLQLPDLCMTWQILMVECMVSDARILCTSSVLVFITHFAA